MYIENKSLIFNYQVAMKTLLLAQKYGFDDIRTECCQRLASVKLDTLKNLDGFQDLDGNSMKNILLPQLEKCQSCLKEVLPQLVGLMEFAVHLLKDNSNPSIQRCSEHYKGHEAVATTASEWRLRNCTVCQEMFKRIHKCGRKDNVGIGRFGGVGTITGTICPEYKYGHSLHFNEKIVDVSRTVMDILGTSCFSSFTFGSTSKHPWDWEKSSPNLDILPFNLKFCNYPKSNSFSSTSQFIILIVVISTLLEFNNSHWASFCFSSL